MSVIVSSLVSQQTPRDFNSLTVYVSLLSFEKK